MDARLKKVIGAVVIAGIGFAVGYEAQPFVSMWLEKRRQKKEAIKQAETKGADIVGALSNTNMNVEPQVIEDANGLISLVIVVDDDRAKAHVQKYLAKSNIQNVIVQVKTT